MRTEPRDLDRVELADLLRRHWALDGVALDHLPVGFGGHHWLATDAGGARWFVTADDLEAGFQHGGSPDAAFAALERAYGTAAALCHQAGLEFVVAPLRDREGAVLRRLDARYSVSVAPFVAGTSAPFGAYTSADERRAMGRLVARLHAATEAIDRALPRAEDFAVPSRAELFEALADVDRPWDSGPFAEPVRVLLRSSRRDLERRFREYDGLAAEFAGTGDSWVVTHGEPHSANVVREPGRSLLLVDWDTTLLAPRERDLRMVLDDDLTGWDEYAAVCNAELDGRALELYRLQWDLADVATFVKDLRRPHERTDDTLVAWEALTSYLA